MYLTGVQLEVGSVATEFEHEPFGTTLRKCLRYFFAHSGGNPGVNGSTPNTNPDTNVGTASCQSTSSISYNLFLPVPMRVIPTIYSTVTGSTRYRLNSAGANTNSGSDPTINTVLTTHTMASGDLSGFSGLSAGQAGNVRRYQGSGILGSTTRTLSGTVRVLVVLPEIPEHSNANFLVASELSFTLKTLSANSFTAPADT